MSLLCAASCDCARAPEALLCGLACAGPSPHLGLCSLINLSNLLTDAGALISST